MLISLIIAVAVLAADQLSKYWVQTVLQPIVDIPLWDGVFHFHYARNTGAAFSMLEGQSWLFYIFTVLVVVIMAIYLIRNHKTMHPLLKVNLGLIIGGALGNFIDRVALGYVVDFLYVKIINFAIFNVADMALVVGCILLGFYILFIHDKHTAKLNKTEENDESDGGNDHA